MNAKSPQSKSPAIIGPTYYGIVRRVASKLDVSEDYVSRVKGGRVQNQRIQTALLTEQKLMDMELQRG